MHANTVPVSLCPPGAGKRRRLRFGNNFRKQLYFFVTTVAHKFMYLGKNVLISSCCCLRVHSVYIRTKKCGDGLSYSMHLLRNFHR